MTQAEFAQYILDNKPTDIDVTANEYAITLHFKNGESIEISCGYDGFLYYHSSEYTNQDTTKLREGLQEVSESIHKSMIEKYGNEGIDYWMGRIKATPFEKASLSQERFNEVVEENKKQNPPTENY